MSQLDGLGMLKRRAVIAAYGLWVGGATVVAAGLLSSVTALTYAGLLLVAGTGVLGVALAVSVGDIVRTHDRAVRTSLQRIEASVDVLDEPLSLLSRLAVDVDNLHRLEQSTAAKVKELTLRDQGESPRTNMDEVEAGIADIRSEMKRIARSLQSVSVATRRPGREVPTDIGYEAISNWGTTRRSHWRS